MQIYLYVNRSEKNSINKSLSSSTLLTGNLRNESSIITPTFDVQANNVSGFNYCYIPEFGRYYFISDITAVRTTIWRIKCDVDVLMSFKTDILNLDVIVSDSTNEGSEPYFSGDVWQTTVKTKTDIISFSSGLLNDGEYILITSGGVASGS